MPSKGIHCYTYINVPGCQIEFSVPKSTSIVHAQKEIGFTHLEIDKKNISGLFNFSGIFRFRVTQDGSELINKWVQVNTLTGNLEQGNMKAMEDQIALVVNGIIITYCFYDADNTGAAGLPKQNQCFVTVTPNYANWMAMVAVPGSPAANKPFSRFVLPAAHDVGMNSMQQADALLQKASSIFLGILKVNYKVFQDIGSKTVDTILKGIAPNIVRGLSVTQKDSLSMILNTGARYFEYRPAYLHDAIRSMQPIPDVLYFMHGPVPGMPYAQFLAGCVDFLLRNPGEIIVVQNRWDGVPAQCARPSDQDLTRYLNEALQPASGGLIAGNQDDMLNLTVDQLRNQRKRLIILQNVDSYSTYDDKFNATLNGDSIVAQFQKLTIENQRGRAFTNLQCQATATNIPAVVAYSSVTADVSNSCLLATKGVCSSKTMTWIKNNAFNKLGTENLIVVMDDFVDGAMCDISRDLSIQRFNA